MRLVAPSAGGLRALAVDASVATRVEESLHAARDLVTQHDADGAERALARAEGLLRAHPELPQGAWLLAEVHRGWATRFGRLDPVDSARAAREWRAAAALDGGRAAGVGEPSASPEAAVPWTLAIAGSAGSVELSLDGTPIALGRNETPAGTHQLVATSAGLPIFAEWVQIAPDAHVGVALPSPEPCSSADLASSSPACPTWVTARAGAHETFFVRVCGGGAGCGPELLVGGMTPLPDHHDVSVRHGLPAWATVTIVSASAILAGIAAGAIGWAALPTTTKVVFQPSPPPP